MNSTSTLSLESPHFLTSTTLTPSASHQTQKTPPDARGLPKTQVECLIRLPLNPQCSPAPTLGKKVQAFSKVFKALPPAPFSHLPGSASLLTCSASSPKCSHPWACAPEGSVSCSAFSAITIPAMTRINARTCPKTRLCWRGTPPPWGYCGSLQELISICPAF